MRKRYPDKVVEILIAIAYTKRPQLGEKQVLQPDNIVGALTARGVERVGVGGSLEHARCAFLAYYPGSIFVSMPTGNGIRPSSR